jgi:hypothetical protein
MRTVNSAWLVLAVANVATALDSGFLPPLAVYYRSDFPAATTPSLPSAWQIEAGSWMAANGTFDSTAAAPTAISTIFEYYRDPNGPPSSEITQPVIYRARMMNQSSDTASLVGMVYGLVNTANYAEVVFSPNGTATVRRAINGAITNVISTSYSGGGRGVWFDAEVEYGEGSTKISVNGIAILQLSQSLPFGRVGLVTHGATARFDKVSLAFRFKEQPFKETFATGLTQEWFTSGQWSVSGGTFNTTSVVATSRASPATAGITLRAEETHQYTLRARMLNPYGGPGNLVGIQFHAGGLTSGGTPGTGEVVFSPTGVAKVNLFYDGANHTVATAPYNGRRNVWFDVRVDVEPGRVAVGVDGVELFEVSTFPLLEGGAGLVTHWAPGRFDDVWYEPNSIFHRLSQTFDGPLPTGWAISGAWDTNGGTLNGSSASQTDIVATACGCWNTDIAYRARLLNQYGGSGNLVGLVYNYQRSSGSTFVGDAYAELYVADYYEVVFAPTGQAFMNKVLNGRSYRVATATHNVPRNTWFDVELLRAGTTTTVKVNGTTIFDRVPQAQQSKGAVGVVAHWAKARFDDLRIADRPTR